jgi:hypothetical protein
MQGAVLQELDP